MRQKRSELQESGEQRYIKAITDHQSCTDRLSLAGTVPKYRDQCILTAHFRTQSDYFAFRRKKLAGWLVDQSVYVSDSTF